MSNYTKTAILVFGPCHGRQIEVHEATSVFRAAGVEHLSIDGRSGKKPMDPVQVETILYKLYDVKYIYGNVCIGIPEDMELISALTAMVKRMS